MDLLAIIQDRINRERTTTRVFTDPGTGNVPADTHDVLEIEPADISIDNASHTTGNDANDAFSETVSTVACKSPTPAIKNKYVMPKSNQPRNNSLRRTAEATVRASQHSFPQGSPPVRQQVQPGSNKKSEWEPEEQCLVDWFMTLYPPAAPFYLGKHRHIVDPIKFFQSMREDIQAGPTGPRARMGTLQSDLCKLRKYFSFKEKDRI